MSTPPFDRHSGDVHAPVPAPAAPDVASSSLVASSAPPSNNVPGILSVAFGVAAIVWQLVFVFLLAAALDDPALTSAVSIGDSVMTSVLGLAGLALGILGLTRRESARSAAGIGVGIAIALLSGVLIRLAYPLAFEVFAG
ncbi:hypothetical protein ACFQZV_01865 [Microbacterium koreense]|uniref:Uncharacterized protein n=1 Tax=Microbacterium koreense TaxID=323761 RepID=A0ABW2ZNP0_9MICO